MPSITLPFIKSQTFNANGNWTAPQGVTQALVIAAGAGSGGCPGIGSGPSNNARGGNGGTVVAQLLTVVPGTIYAVGIGTGGAAGTHLSGAPGAGGDTTFGALLTAPGGSAPPLNGVATQDVVGYAGGGIREDGCDSGYAQGGAKGATVGALLEGGGGGASIGAGGAGGASNAGDGTSAAANTGGGGGGGGIQTSASVGGNGGAGGSGKLTVYWLSVRGP